MGAGLSRTRRGTLGIWSGVAAAAAGSADYSPITSTCAGTTSFGSSPSTTPWADPSSAFPIVAVVSGGNIDPVLLLKVIQHGLAAANGKGY